MASAPPPGYENCIDCPYDPAHQILRHRMQGHLVKCRKNYPDMKLAKCPFNTLHLVPEPELNFHAANCSDRINFDEYKYKVDTGTSKEVGKTIEQPVVSCDDDWDDLNIETYDPQKYAGTAPILRTKIGGPPSERKQFRNSERLRLERTEK